jgi:GNAT superfamily N-acetyltransferase
MTNIRLAREDDAESLPAIERSAGEAFRAIPELAWIADDDTMPVERHRELITERTSWVATDHLDRPIAFLSAQIHGDALHIWEFAVRRDRQGSGIGRAMLETAIGDARTRGLRAVTLTTFRDVGWNAPFYVRLGFQTLDAGEPDERLAEALRHEARRGLPAEKRCAMRLVLG